MATLGLVMPLKATTISAPAADRAYDAEGRRQDDLPHGPFLVIEGGYDDLRSSPTVSLFANVNPIWLSPTTSAGRVGIEPANGGIKTR
jgi:hypothetical protein